MRNNHHYETRTLSSPIEGAFPITPSDKENLKFVTRQVRVTGDSGILSVVWLDGSETDEPVSSGDILDWRIVKVKETGTTATGIRGYY